MRHRQSLGALAIVALAIVVGATGRNASTDPPGPEPRWTRERVLAASSSDLYVGLTARNREDRAVVEGLVALIAAEGTNRAVLLAAFKTLADMKSSEGARSCLSRLDLTVPVPGIRQSDDEEWGWPARKALLVMGWAAVPEILSWIESQERGEADLKTVGATLRDILGPEIGVAVLHAQIARVTRENRQVGAARLRRAAPVLEKAIQTPSQLPWR